MLREDYRALKTGKLVKSYYNNPEEVKQYFGPAGNSEGGEKKLDFKYNKNKASRICWWIVYGEEENEASRLPGLSN